MATFSIGKYTVLGTLGSGAHSTIQHIRRSADAKQYALKVVSIDNKEEQKFLEQARHEFRVAQMLDHANLLKLYALETEKDWLFQVRKVHLLLEYVNGSTLDTAPTLSLPQLVQIFKLVAEGLIHVHKRGVFHADLKPNNIMLSRTGDVKVIDFGLAWIKGEPKGRVQGTPEYIAPETAAHKMVNERTDIYNFGATMYRLVTGELPPPTLSPAGALLPHDAKSWQKMLKPVRTHKPDVPGPLGELIDRCLAYEAIRRPERMSVIQGTLDRLTDNLVRTDADRLEAVEW
jgi:serine/threonine protein kinase